MIALTIAALATPVLIAIGTAMTLIPLKNPTFWISKVTPIRDDWYILEVRYTLGDYPFSIRKIKSNALMIKDEIKEGWIDTNHRGYLLPETGKSSLAVDWSFDRYRNWPRSDCCDGKFSFFIKSRKSNKSRIVISMRIHTSTIFFTRKAKLTVITNKENE